MSRYSCIQSRALLVLFTFFHGLSCSAQHAYENPVDKQTYPGPFETYRPQTPRFTEGQRVVTDQIILLTGELDLKDRVKVEDLTAFIKAIEQVTYKELDKNKLPMILLIQFNCMPDKYEVKMASQGQAEQAVLQQVYDQISRLPPLKVSGDVRFQVEFRVRS